MKKFLILLFIFAPTFILCNEIELVKGGVKYTIECSESKLIDFSNFENKVIKIDSIWTFNLTQKDTLIIFEKKYNFFAIAMQTGRRLNLKSFRNYGFDFLNNLEFLDINNDDLNELITVWGDESSFSVEIYGLDLLKKSFELIFEQTFCYPANSDIGNNIIFNMHEMYVAYGYSFRKTEQHAKFGKIDYVKDNSGEIYFLPLGFINNKNWLKLNTGLQN